MGRRKTFTFRVNVKEGGMIAFLAKYHHRSQSDMVRMLILQAYVAATTKSEKTVHRGSTHMLEETVHE